MLMMPLFGIQVASAATLSSTLNQFTLYEDPLAGPTDTQFILTLTPEPTDQVTTTFSTNGECVIGHNLLDYSAGGAIVTQNGDLVIGLRSVNDSDGEGDHTCDIRFSSVSAHDSEYATPIILEYTVNIVDDDEVLKYEYDMSTLTVSRLEEGKSLVEQYQIDVSTPPHYGIAITANADSQCDLLTGSPQVRTKSLSQTIPAGSSASIEFTLIAVDDTAFEGIHQCSVQHITSTLDAEYKEITIPPYTATLLDNDANPNIPDEREYEGGLIYYRDANFDDIDDSEQPAVTSFVNSNRGLRQGLVLFNALDEVSEKCSFVDAVTAEPFDEDLSAISSTHGVLHFEVACDGDEDFKVVWLLDDYNESASDWTIYDSSVAGELIRMNAKTIVHNLGDKFTTGIVLDFEQNGKLSFVQSDPATTDELLPFEETLTADVNNSRLNSIALVSGLSAVAAILWLIYRRFFSNVDTTKSRYPRVDRF